VKLLSVSSVWLFAALIVGLATYAGIGPAAFGASVANVAGYFTNMHKFVFPITDYHEFYLFWWFAWSIMIGQFTSRFIGGLTTWQLLLALLVVPSIPIAIWFAVLYHYYLTDISTAGFINLAMILVGITFVINSLDSLIRLYTDNLNLTARRFGKARYLAANVAALFALAVLFQTQWLRIEWIGTIVIGLYVACVGYILVVHRHQVAAITASPADRVLDFDRINRVQ
jgi:choline-glycine betaine transporter